MTIRSSLIERTSKAGQSHGGVAPVRADIAPSPTPLPRSEPPHPLRPQLTSKHGAAGSRNVRAGIMARLRAIGGGPGSAGRSWSPQVRAQAQARWGGALSTRQRVIVKAHVARHSGGAKAASKVLVAHVRYLARSGTGREDEQEVFFGPEVDGIAGREHVSDWAEDRHHFRFIVSAEHGDKIDDLKAYIRETMQRVASDLKEPNLNWIAINHYDTDQPHSHILIRGKRADGRNLVIPRAVMGYGFRARAQEHAQELLGDLSRDHAEVRLRSQITADRYTELDKHLSRHMDDEGVLGSTVGLDRQGTYAAMMRGRIAYLEKLGLAHRTGQSIIIATDFRRQLATLAARGDVIRLFHERLNQGAKTISPLQQGEVRGQVVSVGYHDRDLQASPFAIVRDERGHEHYSRVKAQAVLPQVGSKVTLSKDGRGNVRLVEQRQFQDKRELRTQVNAVEVKPEDQRLAQIEQPAETLKALLERKIKADLGIHKHFIGIKTTQTEGIYRGTLDTLQGKFAVIDRGTSAAALRVSQAPQVQIGLEISAHMGKNGMAEISVELGLSR